MTKDVGSGPAGGAGGGPEGGPGGDAQAGARAPVDKVVEHYPAPEPELPPPTFKQALIGYGSILLGLVLFGVLIGLLMRFLR